MGLPVRVGQARCRVRSPHYTPLLARWVNTASQLIDRRINTALSGGLWQITATGKEVIQHRYGVGDVDRSGVVGIGSIDAEGGGA